MKRSDLHNEAIGSAKAKAEHAKRDLSEYLSKANVTNFFLKYVSHNELRKNEITATLDFIELFRSQNIVDYNNIGLGKSNIVKAPCLVIIGSKAKPTRISFSRPFSGNGRHKRFWISNLKSFIRPYDLNILAVNDGWTYLYNCSVNDLEKDLQDPNTAINRIFER